MLKGLECEVRKGLWCGFSKELGLGQGLGLTLVSLSVILKLPIYGKTCLIP